MPRELFIPGCSKAFIARTSPSLNIRRGRLITCDYLAQGQAAGTAAALCAARDIASRELDYDILRGQLDKDGVYFES